MTDIVAFIRARLDEDEQVARAVPSAFDLFDGTGIVVMPLHGGLTRSVTLPASVARFVVRHDPARVLREVAAKRRLLFQFEHRRAATLATVQPATGGVWDDLLRMLAAPWSDHHEWRGEWRP